MKYTPEPWRIRKPSGYAPDSVYEIETDRPNESHGETIAAITKGSSNSNANAKLIAAAPELVEAIIDLFNQLDEAGFHSFVLEPQGISFDKINKVLEKATGGIV